MNSWVESANSPHTDFPIENLPYGVFECGTVASVGVAIGEQILDLRACSEAGLLDALSTETVLACAAADMNVVLQRPGNGQQFDLIIATNVLVYYDTLRQALALRNIAAMLRPGGIFLTNNNLREFAEIPIASAGYTTVRYGEGAESGDHLVWYRKR